MPEVQNGLYYSKEDEWVKVEGETAIIGITDYAQDALSDIVYLELPEADASFQVGEIFGVVESVKAASDLYSPLSGVVVAANEDLVDTPELINEDPFGAAWMIKVTMADAGELDKLMNASAYAAYCAERE